MLRPASVLDLDKPRCPQARRARKHDVDDACGWGSCRRSPALPLVLADERCACGQVRVARLTPAGEHLRVDVVCGDRVAVGGLLDRPCPPL
jgi:hypothetical protein